MNSGDAADAQPNVAGAGLEKLGLWLMGAYWLAMLAIFAADGLAGG